MLKAFELIHGHCKKRHQRGNAIKLIGIISLECNFNPEYRTYSPHYHVIVPSKEIAELLVKEWLIQWRPTPKSTNIYKYTHPVAQKISKVTSLRHSLIETIKCGSKIFTEPDLNNKAKHTLPPIIYARALDNILVAMKGKRIFKWFGFNLPQQETRQAVIKLVENYETWLFPADANDWVNSNTGEALTGYMQPFELSYLRNECINTNHS